MKSKLIYFLLAISTAATISAAVFADTKERRYMALQTFGSTVLATALTLINPGNNQPSQDKDIEIK